jgi:DNA-directed RNA polymerase
MHVILTKCPKLFGKLLLLSTLQIFLENLMKRYVQLRLSHTSFLHFFKFRERYKHHKVPLDGIGGKKGTLIKNLHLAGSRVLEVQAEAEALALTQNVRFEQDMSEEPQLYAADTDTINRQNPDFDLLASLNEDSLDEEDDKTDDMEAKLMAGKFVNMTDLLPPVPAKGNFKVEAIKGSQYFFS